MRAEAVLPAGTWDAASGVRPRADRFRSPPSPTHSAAHRAGQGGAARSAAGRAPARRRRAGGGWPGGAGVRAAGTAAGDPRARRGRAGADRLAPRQSSSAGAVAGRSHPHSCRSCDRGDGGGPGRPRRCDRGTVRSGGGRLCRRPPSSSSSEGRIQNLHLPLREGLGGGGSADGSPSPAPPARGGEFLLPHCCGCLPGSRRHSPPAPTPIRTAWNGRWNAAT